MTRSRVWPWEQVVKDNQDADMAIEVLLDDGRTGVRRAG
jgi:hypothetical protein